MRMRLCVYIHMYIHVEKRTKRIGKCAQKHKREKNLFSLFSARSFSSITKQHSVVIYFQTFPFELLFRALQFIGRPTSFLISRRSILHARSTTLLSLPFAGKLRRNEKRPFGHPRHRWTPPYLSTLECTRMR